MTPEAPAYCTLPRRHWPLPDTLEGAWLSSVQFAADRWHPDDFARAGVPPTAGVAKRQAEHLAGRLCARDALLALTGQPDVPAVGADRAPQWPNGVTGSITHGEGWAAAVVARTAHWRGLGLDVERLLPESRAERVQAAILTPAERAACHHLSAARRALCVTLAFSLKESLYKALYPLVRRYFHFQDAELLDLPAAEPGRVRLRLLADLNDEWRRGSLLSGQFALFDGRLLSLVAIET